MNDVGRKIVVGVVSFGAILAVYLVYSRFNETPPIGFDKAIETSSPADANVASLEAEVGMVGNVGIGTVRNAKFVAMNDDKEVEREFGFEKLLHESGSQWGLEKPFINIFRDNFKIYITADKGDIRLESDTSTPMPADGALTGNVVVRIEAQKGDNLEESFLYFDDIVFVGEKSRFSTNGPIKFVSQDTRMSGKGLELIYNEQSQRIELLKINKLDSLKMKTSNETSLFSSDESKADQVKSQNQQSAKPESPKVTYRCVLNNNVVIETGDQVVLADQVVIDDIGGAKLTTTKTDPATQGDAVTQVGSQDSKEQLTDISVRCDGGLVVTAMGGSLFSSTLADEGMPLQAEPGKTAEEFSDSNDRTTFVSQKIHHSISKGDTVASGASVLTFYTNRVNQTNSESSDVPVKISADKQISFNSASNQIQLTGNGKCTMTEGEENYQQLYKLSGPRFTVDLSRSDADGSVTNISHFRADSGLVRLETVETLDGEQLGGMKLKCQRFDYDAEKNMFTAAGPGLIAMDNSNVAQADEQVRGRGISRRCYAIVEDFQTLEYFLGTGQIIADSNDGQILISYIPVNDSNDVSQIKAAASRIEIDLKKGDGDVTELSGLRASGGVTYEEKDIQFAGSELVYDSNSSTMAVKGDELEPCLFNGSAVDHIEYDLNSGKVKADITGEGAL